MKTPTLYLCILLFFCYGNLYAQNKTAKKQDSLTIQISDVRNMGYVNNQFYLHSINTTFIYNREGKLLKKVNHDVNKGNYFDNELKYSISTDGRIYDESKELINVSKKLLNDNKIARFLSRSENNFFSCLVDPNNLSYSNGIFKINSNGYSLFTYLVGIPAGLYIEKNNIWYLYHKSTPNQNGMLRKYDFKTGELLLEIEIPVIEPTGLCVQSGMCFVYSNHSQKLVTLNIGGN